MIFKNFCWINYGLINHSIRRRQWHPTPVLLPGKSHGRRSLVGCSPRGCKEGNMTERLHFHFSLSWIGEGNGNPLQCSCLENPRDRGAWWSAVHGVAKSRTQLSDFTFTFHFHALEKEMATHSSVLAWRIPGTGEPGGLSSLGSHRVGHDWSELAAAAATNHNMRQGKHCKKFEVWNQITLKVSLSSSSTLKKNRTRNWGDIGCLFSFFARKIKTNSQMIISEDGWMNIQT